MYFAGMTTLNELAERPTVREVLEPWAESRHRPTLEPRAGLRLGPSVNQDSAPEGHQHRVTPDRVELARPPMKLEGP
jgi:hypothetical protein